MVVSMQQKMPGLPPAVYCPHPLMPSRDRQIINAELYPNETLGQYLERTGIMRMIGRRPVVVTISGMSVRREFWYRCRPKTGTFIQIQAVMHGGGGESGGKNPLATVLQLGLLIAAPYLAPGIAGALGVTGKFAIGAITFGISAIGGLAINAIFPPPRPPQREFAQQAPESPTYSLSGGSNRIRPYEPMPVIMGTHRIFPDAGAKTYTEFEGDDQYLYQVFDFGYNSLDLSDFKIGTTPLSNYSGVETQVSGVDGALTLFPVNVDVATGAALTAALGWIVRNSSPNATGLAVEITGQQYGISDDGTVINLDRTIEIEYRAVGAGSWLPFWAGASAVTISSGRRAPVRKTFKINVSSGQYEVRARRTSADETSDRNISDLAWSQLRTYQPDTADYTGRQRVALKIKASGQINGTVDQFSAIARAKALAWNGSAWVEAQTSNPAWWVLAAARGKFVGTRRVWGGGIAEARLGLENIKAFGDWCDSKGLTFNGVFDRQQSVYDMISAIALRGRGTISRSSGMVEVVWDAPNQPAVAVFGMSNIKLDSFEIEYSTEQLADEVVATFINPENDWQQDVVRVLAPGVTDPVRSRTIDLFGCTSKTEAGHDANLYVAANVHRTTRYRWQMDWEGMPVSRGEVGYLSHDLASYDYSGRLIEDSTASVLKLERTVPLNASGSYVTLVKPDGTFATYAVAAGAGDSSTLTLVTPLGFNPGADPDHPPYDYRWLYGATATPGKKIKIEAIAMKGYDTVELTAIDETADYYDSEKNPYIHVPVAPIFNNAVTVSNVQLSEDGIRAGNGYLVRVTATWDAGPGFSFADISVSVGGEPAVLIGQDIRARSFDFNVTDGSALVVSVTAYGALGRIGVQNTASVSKTIDFAGAARPFDVSSFTISGGSFSWTENAEVDVVGYRIRFHYGDQRSFDDASELHAGLLTSSPYTPAVLPTGKVTFLIVAEDAAGLMSANPAVIVTGLGDQDTANIVEQIDFRALDWPGTITDGSVIGSPSGNIEADTTTSFYDVNASAPFYGLDSEPFYGEDVFHAMTYETAPFAISAALDGSRMTLDATIAGDTYYIQYRDTGPGPLYGADGDPFYGADADPFYDAPQAYTTWPGAITVNNGEYQFKVSTDQSEVQGLISAMTAVIDAPDIWEYFDDIVTAPGGTRLVLTKPFTVVKNIRLTLQDDGGTAVSARVLDKNLSPGPLVDCINGSQTSVTGLIDGRVGGY